TSLRCRPARITFRPIRPKPLIPTLTATSFSPVYEYFEDIRRRLGPLHCGFMIWEPSQHFIESTNVWRFMRRLGFSDREAFLLFSREQPERFWDEVMREMRVEWFQPYGQVVDTSRGVEWAQWRSEE